MIALVSTALRSFSFSWANEADLQRGIALALDRRGIAYQREHELGDAGRVDFFLAGLALEVKAQGSRFAVIRQLHRYAEHTDVDAILLVTPSLKLDVPPALCGKPAAICRIPRL